METTKTEQVSLNSRPQIHSVHRWIGRASWCRYDDWQLSPPINSDLDVEWENTKGKRARGRGKRQNTHKQYDTVAARCGQVSAEQRGNYHHCFITMSLLTCISLYLYYLYPLMEPARHAHLHLFWVSLVLLSFKKVPQELSWNSDVYIVVSKTGIWARPLWKPLHSVKSLNLLPSSSKPNTSASWTYTTSSGCAFVLLHPYTGAGWEWDGTPEAAAAQQISSCVSYHCVTLSAQ